MRKDARVLLDVYHMLGVVPVDVAALDVDFAVGGSYKYLRGGPGACFLYVHPRHLDAGLRTLDVGWFAKRDAFEYARPDPPEYAPGGDAWLESTPAVLPLYQARAGQLFTLAIGVPRLRAWSLAQQERLIALLARHGIEGRGASAGSRCVRQRAACAGAPVGRRAGRARGHRRRARAVAAPVSGHPDHRCGARARGGGARRGRRRALTRSFSGSGR